MKKMRKIVFSKKNNRGSSLLSAIVGVRVWKHSQVPSLHHAPFFVHLLTSPSRSRVLCVLIELFFLSAFKALSLSVCSSHLHARLDYAAPLTSHPYFDSLTDRRFGSSHTLENDITSRSPPLPSVVSHHTFCQFSAQLHVLRTQLHF